MCVVSEKIVQAGVCLGHDGRGIWLLTRLRHSPRFLTVDVSRRNNSVGQVLPYVPSCRWRDDCDRGSVQNGSPFYHRGLKKTGPLRIWNQMPGEFVIPSHLGRRRASELRRLKVTCAAMLSQVLPKSSLTPLFLKQAGWLPDVPPNVVVNLLFPQRFWVRLNPHVLFIFRYRSRRMASWFINFRPPKNTGWILQPRTLCFRLLRMFKST